MEVAGADRPAVERNVRRRLKRLPWRNAQLWSTGSSGEVQEWCQSGAIDFVSRLNDRVEDRIENAEGWESIDDLDNADPAATVAQYTQLPEVEYAEPN